MKKIWKKIEKINFLTCSKLLEELKKNNFKISPWIEDIVKKNNYKFNNNKFPIKLVRKYVREFGFNNPVELQMIYKKIEKLGYKLVPPEIAIYVRLIYKEQLVLRYIYGIKKRNIVSDLFSRKKLKSFPHHHHD